MSTHPRPDTAAEGLRLVHNVLAIVADTMTIRKSETVSTNDTVRDAPSCAGDATAFAAGRAATRRSWRWTFAFSRQRWRLPVDERR